MEASKQENVAHTVRVVIDVQPVINRDIVADITSGEMENADAMVHLVAELVCAEAQRVPPFDVVDSEPRVVRVWPAVRIGEQIRRLADGDVDSLVVAVRKGLRRRDVFRVAVRDATAIDILVAPTTPTVARTNP